VTRHDLPQSRNVCRQHSQVEHVHRLYSIAIRLNQSQKIAIRRTILVSMLDSDEDWILGAYLRAREQRSSPPSSTAKLGEIRCDRSPDADDLWLDLIDVTRGLTARHLQVLELSVGGTVGVATEAIAVEGTNVVLTRQVAVRPRVYEIARQLGLPTIDAIKLLREARAVVAGNLGRMRREARG